MKSCCISPCNLKKLSCLSFLCGLATVIGSIVIWCLSLKSDYPAYMQRLSMFVSVLSPSFLIISAYLFMGANCMGDKTSCETGKSS